MKYFKIYYEYDLTEGRGFSRHVYVAVCPSRFDSPFTIAERYAIDVLCEGHFAGVGCQGYGLQKYYELIESDKEDYDFFDRKRGETICLHLGDNISYISDFATYEITE